MNTVMSAISQRNAAAKLVEPAPNAEQVVALIHCALRAPDHAALRPWRFIVIEGDRREFLADCMIQAKEAESGPMDAEQKAKLAKKPFRAPMIIVPVLVEKAHPKVPRDEQVLSIGAATENLWLALESLGFSAIWRTGSLAFSQEVHDGLGLATHEQVMGFVYVGTRDPKAAVKSIPEHDIQAFFDYL